MHLLIRANKKVGFFDGLMYVFLFTCIFTSFQWSYAHELTQIEIFRFDKIRLFGQVNIFSLFAAIFFVFIFFAKFGPHRQENVLGGGNFLKNIFWLYLIPVNILVYMAIYLKEIPLNDLGIKPIVIYFTFLVITYYIQDIFLRKKTQSQLISVLTVLQALFLGRSIYSILKYHLGYGTFLNWLGKVRIGQENDFADFFILLFLIALVRLLFEKSEDRKIRRLNVASLIASSYIIIFSFRRYMWIEYALAIAIIFSIYSLHKGLKTKRVIVIGCLLIFILSSIYIAAGPERLTRNYYLGRFLTAFSLIDSRFESEYGTDTNHPDHLREGWYNIKKNWLLGVSVYGGKRIERDTTKKHTDTYFHNAYIEMWLEYGLLGFILFILIYINSIFLGYKVFNKQKHWLGLILGTFIVCQLIKNLVWHTLIHSLNVTIIYILLISIVIKFTKFTRNNEFRIKE